MTSLNDKIKALAIDPEDPNERVSLAQVLELTKDAVSVELNSASHKAEPEGEVERLTWAVLDTTWRLLREYAVRTVFAEMHQMAEQQGVELDSDEEIFRQLKESGDPEAPTSYFDLSVECPVAATALSNLFLHLEEETRELATNGFDAASALDEIAEMTGDTDVQAFLRDIRGNES